MKRSRSRGLDWDSGGAASSLLLAGQHGSELVTESLPCDAVEEEVYRMVDEHQEVGDRLRDVVRRVGAMLPVRLADQQDNTRSDADQKRERDAQTHEGRLTKTADGRARRSISGSGRGGVENGYGPIPNPLCVDQSVHDRAVKYEDQHKRDSHNQGQYEPRPDVVQEELVLQLRAADTIQFSCARVHGTARPELVKVFDEGQKQDGDRRDDCTLPTTHSTFAQRKTHRHEPATINKPISDSFACSCIQLLIQSIFVSSERRQ